MEISKLDCSFKRPKLRYSTDSSVKQILYSKQCYQLSLSISMQVLKDWIELRSVAWVHLDLWLLCHLTLRINTSKLLRGWFSSLSSMIGQPIYISCSVAGYMQVSYAIWQLNYKISYPMASHTSIQTTLFSLVMKTSSAKLTNSSTSASVKSSKL
jgi:hypothetical protein